MSKLPIFELFLNISVFKPKLIFLLNCHPELDYVVDERGTEHAFVLGSSEEMGEVVAEFVRMDYGGGREKVS